MCSHWHGVFVQLGIILCASVRSRSMVETRVHTEAKAMLGTSEAQKDLYFEALRASTRVGNWRKLGKKDSRDELS